MKPFIFITLFVFNKIYIYFFFVVEKKKEKKLYYYVFLVWLWRKVQKISRKLIKHDLNLRVLYIF